DRFTTQDYEYFNKAYAAYRKLEMLMDYTFQLATVNAATRVNPQELLNSDNLFDPGTGEALDPATLGSDQLEAYEESKAIQNLLIGSVTSRAALNVVRDIAFSSAYYSYRSIFKNVVGPSINQLQSLKNIDDLGDGTVDLIRILDDLQALGFIDDLERTRLFDTAVDALDNNADDFIRNVDDLIKKLSNTDEVAKIITKKRSLFNTLANSDDISKLVTSYKSFGAFLKKTSTAKSALKGALGAAAIGVTVVSIVGEFLLKDAHKFASEQMYDRLRELYQGDLENMYIFLNDDFESTVGYKPSENMTFSGGSPLERSYSRKDQLTDSKIGHYGSTYNTEFDVGVKLKNGLFVGFGAGTETGSADTKITTKIDFSERVSQRIATETNNVTEEVVGYVLEDDDDGDQFNVHITHALQNTDNNFTPYFHLVGGRSSGPYEEGTISRDMPTITLEDAEGNKYPNIFFDQDPEVHTRVPLKITAGNEFEEGRTVVLTTIPNANTGNAQLLVANGEPYTGREIGFFVEPGEALYMEMLVTHTEGTFEHPDIGLVVRPNDLKSDFFSDGPQVFDSVYFSVYFRKPVSPVSLNQRNGAWFINAKDPDPELKEAENYIFTLEGFDVEGEKSNLSFLQLEYKRANEEFFDWKPIPRLLQDQNGLDSIAEKVGIDELAEFYERNKRIYQEPTFNFEWDLEKHERATGDKLIDGNYLIRAISADENGLVFYSDPYEGVIDRVAPSLADQPEPKDFVYSQGDDILITFDENIDGNHFSAHGFGELIVYNLDGTVKEHHDILTSSEINASVTDGGLDIEIGDLPFQYDGHEVEVNIAGIQDGFGNSTPEDTIRWSFKLDYSKELPSSIALLSENNWMYNAAETSSRIPFVIADYDVFEKASDFDYVALEVMEEGAEEWEVVAYVEREELADRYVALGDPNLRVVDTLYWDINGFDEESFEDGHYSVRAVAHALSNQTENSESLSGQIDRVFPQLVGVPNPADERLSRGELVTFNYSESIDHDSLKVYVRSKDVPLSTDVYDVGLTSNGLNVIFDEAFMADFPSEEYIEVGVTGITDFVGNPADSTGVRFVFDRANVPTSPINVENLDAWLVNTNTSQRLPIILKDYHLFNASTVLDSITLEFRRYQNVRQQGQQWTHMTVESASDFEGFFDVIKLDKETLTNRFTHRYGLSEGETPIDTIFWNTTNIPDGPYEIRAIAHGGRGFNASGNFSGLIDRTPPQVFGAPEPQDGVYSVGDAISISFTEEINYAELAPNTIYDSIEVFIGERKLVYGEYTASISGSDIILNFDETEMELNNSQRVSIDIRGIEDVYGNKMLDPIHWKFTIEDFSFGPSYVEFVDTDRFLINKELSDAGEEIKFVIREFDAFAEYSRLDKFELQVKRLSGQEWIAVDEISQKELQTNHEARLAIDPEAFAYDTLRLTKSDYTDLLDGEYEARIQVFAGNQVDFSSPRSGSIDQRAPALAIAEPTDGILSLGDNLSASFDQSIDVERVLNSIEIEIYNLTEGIEVTSFFRGPVITSGELAFTGLDTAQLTQYDGDVFQALVQNVYDLNDNKSEPISWTFQLDLNRFGPSPISIKEPGGSFVINQAQSFLDIVLEDFEFNNTKFGLDQIRIEASKLTGGNADWNLIEEFNIDEIANQNQGLEVPELRYTWNLDADNDGLADSLNGGYLLRAVSVVGSQTRLSDDISGIIDLSAPKLLSFSPEDGIYSDGEELSFSFNENLREDLLVDFEITDMDGGFILNKDEFFLRTQSASEVILTLKAGKDLSEFNGETLLVKLTGVEDAFGNKFDGSGELILPIQIDHFLREP
ncbi:MAG: Ig-like domain-containing protein, partial [Bacteroidota bacterium]